LYSAGHFTNKNDDPVAEDDNFLRDDRIFLTHGTAKLIEYSYDPYKAGLRRGEERSI
jgi:hypothetical protein